MTKRTVSALLAATLGLGASSMAWAEQPNQQDLQKQLELLRAEVKELKSARATPAYTDRDVDAAVASVVRDADRRSQLLADNGGILAGHMDGGFRIRSADGNYELQPTFQFQFRSVTNLGDFAGDDSEVADGFEIRRMKFGFKGHAVTPRLKYEFRWGTSRSDGIPELELAYAQYQFADDFAVKGGQWKDNVYREETTSSGRQLAVDRSFLNERLGGGQTDYVQGVSLLYGGGGALRAELAYIDGAASLNTDFRDVDHNFGVSGRVEYKVMGDWKAYDDFSAMGTKKDLLAVGAGGNWSQMGDTNTYYHTLDVQYENPGGLGLFAAYVARLTDADGDAGDDTYDWGFLVQAGYLVSPQWEVFARYDMTVFENDQANGEDTVHEITAGVNYFIKGHNAKFTVDATWLPSGSPAGVSGVGILGQDTDDDQFLLRAQFQLLL